MNSALPEMNCENLGVSYHANQNAWMTQNVFKLWLKAFDMHMHECKVVLLLDNCSAHITVEGLVKHNIALKNTTLLYLPPNTTSKIQPFDTGIFCNFKAHYHRRFNCMLLGRIDRDMEAPSKINVLDMIQLVVASWGLDVKSDTIENCSPTARFAHVISLMMKTPILTSTHMPRSLRNSANIFVPYATTTLWTSISCSTIPMTSTLAMSILRMKSLNELPIQCL